MNETDSLDLTAVDRIVAGLGRERRFTLPILHAIQEKYHYLPTQALMRVCEITEIAPSEIEGVASFYPRFRRKPVGRHLVSVCHGTACHVAGAERVTDAIRRYLKLAEGEDTDRENRFTVLKVACLGCCSLAPVIRVDTMTYGHVAPEGAGEMLEQFLESARKRPETKVALTGSSRSGVQVRIGLGSCCMASGSAAVKLRFEAELAGRGKVLPVKCGACVGMCHRVPLVEFVSPDGRSRTYGNVAPEHVNAILNAEAPPVGIFQKTRTAFRRAAGLFANDASWIAAEKLRLDRAEKSPVQAFLARQKDIVLEGRGEMDPLDLDDYCSRGGYKALERCVRELLPEEVISIIEKSGLRGRGGAGYPTAAKWSAVRNQPGTKKYIVLNGDEGDPGAFMDRMMLESYPHRVLEGLAIAAYAVGADEAYLCIRSEYPLALERVRAAMQQAFSRGFFGERIFGSDFSLRLQLLEGAGAFVCGEETALIASVEGGRGMPRLRPPYPAESGLWGKPTSINNVETYANVPWIVRNGPEAFASLGIGRSRGTKVFALAGKINRGGLIEVPMGITIGEIVEEIGGGIRDGKKFKAAQVGGPSGGCIPASLKETRVDYEELKDLGAMMGSGGLVIMDEDSCMVDMARFFLQFTQNESCGKCTLCRIGTKRMLEILDRIVTGEGTEKDLARLESLSQQVKKNSLCGLGQSAPNPVLTTLKFFRDEYEAHVSGRCPAKRCRALISYAIGEECIGCTLCAQKCPADAIAAKPYERHEIDQKKCIKCGTCAAICPEHAVHVEDARREK